MKTKTFFAILLVTTFILGSTQVFAEYCKVGQIVTGLYKGGLYKAKVIEVKDQLCKVTWVDGSDDPDEWLNPEQMLVQGFYKGKWYNGKIISKEGDGIYKVRWTDGSGDPDELVEIKNLRPR